MPFINDMLDELGRAEESGKQANAPAPASDGPGYVSRFTFNVAPIVARLRERILGQDEAIDAIESVLKVVRADITDRDRPLFVCLFLGPTGVGKTESIRILAEAIHGDRDSFCRVDMNTLSQEHYAAALTGAPPGYVGSREGSTLFDEEKVAGSFSKPGIVLFDEVEKASPQVIQALLNVFDSGFMRVASGEKVIDFRNAMIFMTSNIGAREIQRYSAGEGDTQWDRILRLWIRRRPVRHVIEKKLLEKFEPEFVNRIDNVSIFNWIEGVTVRNVVELEISRLNARLSDHGCRVALDSSTVDFLADRGFDRRFGARALKRAVRHYVEVPLAELLIADGLAGNDRSVVYQGVVGDGEIRFVADK